MPPSLPDRSSNMTPEILKEMGFEGESIAMQASSELCSELHTLNERLRRGEITAQDEQSLADRIEERSKKVWGIYSLESWLMVQDADDNANRS